MLKALNVWVKDAKIYRNNNTPCRVKCSRMTDNVHGVFVYGGKKMVLEQNLSGQSQKMGSEMTEHIVQIPHEKRRRSQDISIE